MSEETGPGPAASLAMQIGGVSDPGRHRPDNQDSIGWTEIATGRDGHPAYLAVLADGAGGHRGGAAASQRALQTILTLAVKIEIGSAVGSARDLLQEANRAVFELAQQMESAGNMGTTGALLLCTGTDAVVAHVGDSRVYLVRHDVCRQVTADHSFVWRLLEKGAIGQEEILTHPNRGVITRCLGIAPEVGVEVLDPPIPMQAEDLFILCSDGLNEVIGDGEMVAVIRDLPPQQAAQALVDLAVRRDTRDNVSAIVAKTVAAPPRWETSPPT